MILLFGRRCPTYRPPDEPKQQTTTWTWKTIIVSLGCEPATPSKYKKVYFRSEKKLVDGAFHSLPGSEQKEKKSSSLIKAFNSGKGVQRRSSRGE